MACQSQNSDPIQDDCKSLVSNSSSSWETLRCVTTRDKSLKLLLSGEESYFKESPPNIRKHLSFSSIGGNPRLQNKELQLDVRKGILASSPIDSSYSRKHVHFDIPCNISKISPVGSYNVLQETDLNLNKMADDDDIIIIEENGGTPKKQKHRVKFSSSTEQSSKELCLFNRETITEHDYKTLADEEFLNDNIINFYLTWLYQKLSDKYKNMIHIYSSYFYSRLKSKPSKKDKDKDKTKAEKAYERVKQWTKKIDIFEKRMLIVPICEESHWYLVIVCNPGHVLSATRDRDFEKKRNYQKEMGETKGRNPFIMVLDSLGGSHSTAVSKMRSYLTFEHLEKRKVPMNFGKEKMGEKHPPIPLQPNDCDCGLFLLHYVELIFKDPEMFLGAILPDLTKWFNTEDVELYKREEIAKLIQKISETNGKNVKFPKINFPSRNAEKSSRSSKSDPRVKRMKEGSLGELLATNHPDKMSSRRARFTGSYRDNSPDRTASPTRKSARISDSSSDKPKPLDSQPVSFQIKRKSPLEEGEIKEEFDAITENNGRNKSLNSSWSSISKSKKDEVEKKFKRFKLKRDTPETNPKYVKSSREMYHELMKGSKKKS